MLPSYRLVSMRATLALNGLINFTIISNCKSKTKSSHIFVDSDTYVILLRNVIAARLLRLFKRCRTVIFKMQYPFFDPLYTQLLWRNFRCNFPNHIIQYSPIFEIHKFKVGVKTRFNFERSSIVHLNERKLNYCCIILTIKWIMG